MFFEWVDDVYLLFGVHPLFQLDFCLYVFMDETLGFHLLCFYLNGKFGCFNGPNDLEAYRSCLTPRIYREKHVLTC